MDATAVQHYQGNRRHCFVVVAVALFCVPLSLPEAGAQAFGLRSRDGAQQITHSLTAAPQAFKPVRWDIQNAQFRNGCVVQWQAEAFVHEAEPTARADCELAVQLTHTTGNARWKVASASDRTMIAAHKDSAAVSVVSDSRGHARVDIVLRFIGDDVSRLSAGNYHTTLTGTITGL